MKMKNYIQTTIFALAFLFASGCGTLERIGEHETAAKLTIQYATLKYIDGDSGKAERVIEVVGQVRQYLDESEQSEISAIHSVVLNQVDFGSLDSADEMLVRGLVDMVRVEIDRRVASQFLTEGDKVFLGNVLNWIEDAAKADL